MLPLVNRPALCGRHGDSEMAVYTMAPAQEQTSSVPQTTPGRLRYSASCDVAPRASIYCGRPLTAGGLGAHE